MRHQRRGAVHSHERAWTSPRHGRTVNAGGFRVDAVSSHREGCLWGHLQGQCGGAQGLVAPRSLCPAALARCAANHATSVRNKRAAVHGRKAPGVDLCFGDTFVLPVFLRAIALATVLAPSWQGEVLRAQEYGPILRLGLNVLTPFGR
jgi:hypothetical protein